MLMKVYLYTIFVCVCVLKQKYDIVAIFDVGNSILEELPFVKERVTICFPEDYDVFHRFSNAYSKVMYKSFQPLVIDSKLASADMMKIVKWVKFHKVF